MSHQRWQQVKDVFERVYELEEQQRATRLTQLCGDDPGLRAEVESLLEAHACAPQEFECFAVDLPGTQRVDARDIWVGRRIGAYKIIRRIASGGMSTVYEAARADAQFERKVAVKLIDHRLASKDMVRRFRNERQLLARLDHPYIARLFDGGVSEDGLPYLVMELVGGEPIIRFCDRAQLTIDRRLELFRKICSAVHYAHQNLIVHRDLKPGNILVTRTAEPKLLDFGIAKLLHPDADHRSMHVTRTCARSYTPDYASPEQIRGEAISTACDIYSLGVILYELLTGERPYKLSDCTMAEMEDIVCERTPKKPSTTVILASSAATGAHQDGSSARSVGQARHSTVRKLHRRLRGDLDNIVMVAMRKEPQRRYGSVEQLSEDIARHLKHLPVRARTETWNYRLSKFILRNRTGVAAALLVAAALVAGVVGVALKSHEVTVQRDAAQVNLRRAAQVSQFLVDLFGVSDPHEAQGETITAREILDRGARRIHDELQDQPLTQATLMNTMGAVYVNLGLYESASQLLEEALAIRRRMNGDEDLEVAETLDVLSSLRITTGEYALAESLSREALDIRRKRLGNRHLKVAQCLNNLGRALQEKGDYPAAERALREALAMRRDLLGDEDPDVANSRNNLAGLLYVKGDLAGAEALLREAVDVAREVHGEKHPDFATALSNLGFVLHAEGELEAAEPVYLEVLNLRRELLGAHHAEVAHVLNNLGGLAVDRGDFALAEERFTEVLNIYEEAYDHEHPNVARTISNLGLALHKQGKYEEAEPLLRDSVAVRRKTLPPQHPELAVSLNRLAALLIDIGKSEEAYPLLEESYQICQASLPPQHHLVAGTQQLLGQCHKCLDRFDQAETCYLESLEGFSNAQGEHTAQRQQIMQDLVELYESWGRRGQADEYRASLLSEQTDAAD